MTLPEDSTAWTWAKRANTVDGAVEWHGDHPYRTAVVTRSGGTSGGWQARIGEQYSPYYRTPQGAKAWAERYGRARAQRRRNAR